MILTEHLESNENTRLHYGDITDLKFANEIIDEQRKAIKILKEENEQLQFELKECNEKTVFNDTDLSRKWSN